MIKQTVLSQWNYARWIKLALGVFMVILSFFKHDGIFGVIGGILLFQAILNTGCFGSAGCAAPPKAHARPNDIEDVEFEEVKEK
jgi:hypothetical protein